MVPISRSSEVLLVGFSCNKILGEDVEGRFVSESSFSLSSSLRYSSSGNFWEDLRLFSSLELSCLDAFVFLTCHGGDWDFSYHDGDVAHLLS